MMYFVSAIINTSIKYYAPKDPSHSTISFCPATKSVLSVFSNIGHRNLDLRELVFISPSNNNLKPATLVVLLELYFGDQL